MHIFEQEKLDGLEEKIKSSASFTYACSVETNTNAIDKKSIKSLASIEDKDLYYTQSILVSTDWNKNDDIFDKAEVWAAKDTPQHKPTNIEHEEGKIVGHIVANWPITKEGIIIDKDTPVENLPDKYQVLTASVIYTGFTDPELRERSQKLISEIEEGKKYVSMECFFNGFDYGLVNNATGEFKILERNEETSFLTKHLRSYGGLGEYQNNKLGRVLRNITFSGKGFVDRPANPESIIFQKEDFKFIENEKKYENKKEGVFSNQANIKEANMSSENPITQDIKVEAMNDCAELVKEAYASVDQFKTKASELEGLLAENTEALEATKKALNEMYNEKQEAAKMYEEEMKKKKDEMEKMKADIDAANEVIAAYKDKEMEMMKKEKNMKRMASLIEAGLENEAAAEQVEKFESLADDTFENMLSLFAAMKMKKEDMTKKQEEAMMMKKKASENELNEALENVQASTEVDLSVGSDDTEDESNSTRAALIDFVYNRLGKTLNKGE